MSEIPVEQSSPDIPDILLPQPLQRALNVEIETNILDPVSHNYNPATGGSTRFVLPSKAVMDSPNATINFEICNSASDATTMFPIWSGGLGCINNITCRVGGSILSRIENAGLYATIKKSHTSHSYQSNVLDIHQAASNQSNVRTINAPVGARAIPAGMANKTTALGFSQITNPALDQDNQYGEQLEGLNVGIVHAQQSSKDIRSLAVSTGGQPGPEVSLKLSDLFPIFKEFQMPLFAMAQIEIEIDWNPTVGAAVQFQNVTNNIIVANNPVAAAASANLSAVFAAPPFMSIDYLHYDEGERARVVNQIQTTGMARGFREVIHTRGINAGTSTATPGTQARSSHLLGMAGKEVQNIYVVKRLDTATNPNDTLNNVLLNRNPTMSQFKSSQMANESYNCLINNQKLYNRDVDNCALQWSYLSQCDTGAWNCLPLEYDTMDYNAGLQNVLGNSSVAGVPSAVALAPADVNCATAKLVSGQKHVIGIPLMKQPELGSGMRGNGELIGTAPIQFEYACNKINGATNSPTNLDFFIEVRRVMVITPFGVSVADA